MPGGAFGKVKFVCPSEVQPAVAARLHLSKSPRLGPQLSGNNSEVWRSGGRRKNEKEEEEKKRKRKTERRKKKEKKSVCLWGVKTCRAVVSKQRDKLHLGIIALRQIK